MAKLAIINPITPAQPAGLDLAIFAIVAAFPHL
jgi:hypothetical protein